MTEPRRICVVTGTRAEYGLLKPVIDDLNAVPEFRTQLIVTGMHLAPEFGYTGSVIEDDGLQIDARVDMLVVGDTGRSVAKSIGLGVIGFADALTNLNPDLLLVLGDRFEILAAVQAAVVMRIPVAHIAGGDITEGAFDDSIRHAISKLSAVHFATTENAATRLRQMGEESSRVHMVGSPGLDALDRVELLTRTELQKSLGLTLRPRNLLVTYHPETLASGDVGHDFGELLAALDNAGDDLGLIFTFPNADPSGQRIIDMLKAYIVEQDHAHAFVSLGQLRYLSLMSQVDAVVGNSSSGLYEAPSFGVPTVNIGSRQSGRLKAASVFDCAGDRGSIATAIGSALAWGRHHVVNPYGDGRASPRIVTALRAIPDFGALIRKRFVDGVDIA